jgi:hypothetical protein
MGMACRIFAGWHFAPDTQESTFVLSMEIQSTLGDVPGTCHSRVAPEMGGTHWMQTRRERERGLPRLKKLSELLEVLNCQL